ncbi:hypothetical protein AVEN_56981-1, partial [Araneus ventricosus]
MVGFDALWFPLVLVVLEGSLGPGTEHS